MYVSVSSDDVRTNVSANIQFLLIICLVQLLVNIKRVMYAAQTNV